jgi:hypothetical protein
MHLFNKLFKIFNVNIDLRQIWDDWSLDEIIYKKLLFFQIILQVIEFQFAIIYFYCTFFQSLIL